jgi:FKBP-type peptidyl-prolyl cis-trans isomerase FkpA
MRKALVVLASVGALVAQGVAAQQGTTSDPLRTTSFAQSLHIDLDSARHLDSGVYVVDLATGPGPVVSKGRRLTVQFTVFLPDGTEVQPTTPPVTYPLGNGAFITGVERGIVGMKVGGRRRMIIPPELGYGEHATGPIPANSVLVVDVTVVAQSGSAN